MDDDDRRTVSADGITIEKHVDTDRFKTPAVVLEIKSSIDQETTVTVTEPIPDEFAIEDIGFHPDFGGESWSIAGRTVTFERSIAPGEQYTTVYGVRDVGADEIRAFLDAGTSVVTDHHHGDGSAGDPGVGGETDPVKELLAEEEDESGVVRDVIAGERDSLPDMENTAGAVDDELDTEETGDEGTEEQGDDLTGETEDEEIEDQWGDDLTGETEDEGIEEQGDDLTGEIEDEGIEEQGDDLAEEPGAEESDQPTEVETTGVADETVTGITETGRADGVDGDDEADETAEDDAGQDDEDDREAGGSEEASASGSEYRTLPGSVAEALAAEVRDGTISEDNERALREAFGDPREERGSVDARIQHLQSQVGDLAAYTDALERFLDEYGGDSILDDVERDLAEVSETVDALDDGLDELEEETADIASSLDDVESTLGDAVADIDALDERVGEVDALGDRLDSAETEIDDLLYLEEEVMELQSRTENLADVEETVAELNEERVADLDARLDGIETTIDTLEAEMEEMKAFRDRLSSAFGPGVQAGGEDGE